MARICGVCKRAPREGSEMRPVRLGEKDLEQAPVDEVGLYSFCEDCFLDHRQRYAKRNKLKADSIANDMLC